MPKKKNSFSNFLTKNREKIKNSSLILFYKKIDLPFNTLILSLACMGTAVADAPGLEAASAGGMNVIHCSDKETENSRECEDARAQAKSKKSQRAQSALTRKSATALPISPAFASRDLVMYAGEAVVVDVGDVDRVAIGNGKVATTTVLDKNRLLIIAQDVGDTNVLLWDKKYLTHEINIRVTAQNLKRVISEARKLLETVPGLAINNVGDRIFIEGQDLNESDLGKVKALAAQYPGIVDRTKGRYQKTKDADPSAMVMFDLYFVEFKKSYLQNLGVSWQRSFDGFNIGIFGEATRGPIGLRPNLDGVYTPELPDRRLNGISAAANVSINLPATINLAVDNGDAVLLASPKIASRSGGKAKFTAGGEVPLPTVSQQGTNVEFKPYGILLEVEPQVNGDGSISGIVKAEVSAIDPGLSVMGIPAFLTRRTEADFFSRDGQAVVLSGLYSQELSKGTQKVPFAGDIPLLGALFSSDSEMRKNSELVVFIVPHLYSTDSKLNQGILANTRTMLDRQSQKLNGDGKDILPKLKATSELWGTDLMGNKALGQDAGSANPQANQPPPRPVNSFQSSSPYTN